MKLDKLVEAIGTPEEALEKLKRANGQSGKINDNTSGRNPGLTIDEHYRMARMVKRIEYTLIDVITETVDKYNVRGQTSANAIKQLHLSLKNLQSAKSKLDTLLVEQHGQDVDIYYGKLRKEDSW